MHWMMMVVITMMMMSKDHRSSNRTSRIRWPTLSLPSSSAIPPSVIWATFNKDGQVLLSRPIPKPKLNPVSGFVRYTSITSAYQHHENTQHVRQNMCKQIILPHSKGFASSTNLRFHH